MLNLIKNFIIRFKYHKSNIYFGENVTTSFNTCFEGYNKIGHNTTFLGSIGFASYIGSDSFIHANIGKFTCISSRVVTTRGKHPINQWVSIHPAFYSTRKQCGFSFVNADKFDETNNPVNIGNDVWIGDSVVILDGINISDGGVIAAGAVVTKDVPPYAIVAGVPARIIRYRFDDKTICELIESNWWNKSVSWLRDNVELFESVAKFNSTVNNHE